MCDLHTSGSKARNELKVVLLHLRRVNVKTIPGFINIPLADLSWINLCHNNIMSFTNIVDRPRQCHNFRQYIKEHQSRRNRKLCLP
jgi:hypothetical protein